MLEETRAAQRDMRKGRGGQEDGSGHMKEDSRAQAGAGGKVGSCGDRTLTSHLDGDLPGALIRFCPLRSEDMALGTEPCPAHQEEGH